MVAKKCIIIWIIFVGLNKGAKIGEQHNIIEKLLNAIASRLNDQSDEILKIKQDIAAKPSCPQNWSQFLGYCYHVYKRDFSNFDDAVDVCANKSAFVVDIESEVENKFVRSLTKSLFWIGITDEQEEGDWRSLRNGKPIKFSNWDYGQPQNYASYDEDCALMYRSGLWHDYKCNGRFPAIICKKMVTF